MEVDHIFICTKNKGPEGDLLVDFGIVEGSSNYHPGQGTSNRRFFFHNMMLELLWIEDVKEACSERTKPMRLYDRSISQVDESSPFGIALRPSECQDEVVPFSTWDYHPIYLPESLSIQVAEKTPLSEPIIFYLGFSERLDVTSIDYKEPLKHPLSLKVVTKIIIHVNQESELSEASAIVNQLGNMEIISDGMSFIELEFDGLMANKSKDFRPDLPLVIKW